MRCRRSRRPLDGAVDWVIGLSDSAHDAGSSTHSALCIEGGGEDYAAGLRGAPRDPRDRRADDLLAPSVIPTAARAKEVVMDELAERAGQDPVAFRLAHLEDNPRMRCVSPAARAP